MKTYYSVNSKELGEEIIRETLSDIYNEYLKLKQDDKDTGDNKNYYFVKHEIENNKTDSSNIKSKTDYTTEGKVYKRGNKIYFKSI
jgi:hypothetical protein